MEFDLAAMQNEIVDTYKTFEERQVKWEEVRQQYKELCKKRDQKLNELRAKKEEV